METPEKETPEKNRPLVLPRRPGGLLACCLALLVWPVAGSGLLAQETGDTTDTAPQEGSGVQEEPPEEVTFADESDLKVLEVPIMDREPFDRLFFNEANENWELDVDPVELEGRSINAPIDPSKMDGRLVFTMPDYPGRRYACPWRSLVKIERYVDLVMEEAEKSLKEGDYGTAFRTLLFLSQQDIGQKARISQMMDKCLYEDGELNLENGMFGEALASFEELYKRSPQYKIRGSGGVIGKITSCFDQFVAAKVAEGDYESARSLLDSLRLEYGNRVEDVVNRWVGEMRTRAIEKLREVRAAVDGEDGMLAHDGVREVMYVMPDLPQATTAYNAVVEQFPYIFVGVTQKADDLDVRRIENWSSRRLGYLLNRWLMEYQGPGDEGGIYEFPGGRIQRIDELGLRFRLQLSQNTSQTAVPRLRSYEIASRLFDLASIESEEYYVPWARLVDTIEIEDERSVVFTLRYPHVRPEALIAMPFFAPSDERAGKFFGLYQESESGEQQTVYEFNERYEKDASSQSPRIVERVFETSSEATEALIRGRIDVIDRIFPGDLGRLRSHPDISVRPYLIPTVHMLIPNPRNTHMKSDHFRRALHFGINRSLIVRDMIAGGREIDGFQVVSGPFPPGTDIADQLAYAYNRDVKPREFSPTLSLVLAKQYTINETRRLENEGVKQPEIRMPTLVLAYPAIDSIAAACQAIAQQWRAVGIETELRALPQGVTVPEDDDYDLLYCEIQMQEPLVDAYRLFGRNGLAKLVDPTIEQALRKLDSAYSWADVSLALRRVHQQTANNLTILPLWQIVDHYAWRKNTFNLGNDIVFLYQNLKDWRIDGVQPPTTVSEK